ncbi:hypothetical protein [Rhodococcus opacus]|nr:hypothetical protein [Rhodococcus opacus]
MTADEPHESVGAELAGIAGEAGIGPSELVHDQSVNGAGNLPRTLKPLR